MKLKKNRRKKAYNTMKKNKENKVKKIKASLKQIIVAKKNIKKAQSKWKSMTKVQHAKAQPEGRARKKPDMGGKGKFYRVVVRDKNDFVMFRLHDIGKKGHVERLAGKRANGRWATVSWLIDKNEAHVDSNGILIGDFFFPKFYNEIDFDKNIPLM